MPYRHVALLAVKPKPVRDCSRITALKHSNSWARLLGLPERSYVGADLHEVFNALKAAGKYTGLLEFYHRILLAAAQGFRHGHHSAPPPDEHLHIWIQPHVPVAGESALPCIDVWVLDLTPNDRAWKLEVTSLMGCLTAGTLQEAYNEVRERVLTYEESP